MVEKYKEINENMERSAEELNSKLDELGINYKFTPKEITTGLFEMTEFVSVVVSFWGKKQKSFNIRRLHQLFDTTKDYYFVVLAILKGDK